MVNYRIVYGVGVFWAFGAQSVTLIYHSTQMLEHTIHEGTFETGKHTVRVHRDVRLSSCYCPLLETLIVPFLRSTVGNRNFPSSEDMMIITFTETYMKRETQLLTLGIWLLSVSNPNGRVRVRRHFSELDAFRLVRKSNVRIEETRQIF